MPDYKSKKFIDWILSLITKIIENYGSGNIELIDSIFNEDRICSRIDATRIYIELVIRPATDSSEETRDYFIAKRPVQNTRHLPKSTVLLYNEIMFYQKYAQPNDNIPKYYHSHWRSYRNMVLVLQNMESYGYQSFSQKRPYTYIPYVDGMSLAVREFARFHSKGYIMKELQREKFDKITNFFASYYRITWLEQLEDFQNFFKLLASKTEKYLEPHVNESICKRVRDIFSRVRHVFITVSHAESALCTVCHGNLTSSNILLDVSNTCRPVMLVNFEYVTYMSAVIDLSAYIFLSGTCCTPSEVRSINNIILIYCAQLHICLQDAGIQDEDKYSYDAFLAEYQKSAICGLFIACFYLPVMARRVEVNELKQMDQEDYLNCLINDEEERMCEILSNMILNLNKFGCLHDYTRHGNIS